MFKIKTDGASYSEGIPVNSAVLMLKEYNKIFDASLTACCSFYNIPITDKPSIKINSVRRGSGEFELFLASTTIILPQLPDIYVTAWDYTKKAYSVISTLNKFLKQNGRPMTINVTESPGATVIVSGRDTLQIPADVYKVTAQAIAPVSGIAKTVMSDRNGYATAYYLEDYDGQQKISHDNAEDFISKDFNINDEVPVELEANIFKLNKKTLVGKLEYHDGHDVQERPFIASQEMSVMAAIALSAERCTIIATPERRANILGESTIVRFHISGITVPRQ